MPAFLDDTNAPRSLITLDEARDRVRGDLGLTDSSLLTDANLTAWLNEGQDRLARLLRWYRTFEVMGTTAGTKEYGLPSPSSGRCIQIEEVRYDDRQLYVVTLEELFRYDWNYQQAGTGTPDWYYLRGSTGFGLHVTPDTTDVDILRVLFVALPPHLAQDNELFFCPPGGDDYILAHGKLLASQKDIYGEGRARLAEFRTDRAEALAELRRQVDQVAEREEVVLGSAALTENYGDPQISPWRQITGL